MPFQVGDLVRQDPPSSYYEAGEPGDRFNFLNEPGFVVSLTNSASNPYYTVAWRKHGRGDESGNWFFPESHLKAVRIAGR